MGVVVVAFVEVIVTFGDLILDVVLLRFLIRNRGDFYGALALSFSFALGLDFRLYLRLFSLGRLLGLLGLGGGLFLLVFKV